MRRRVVILGMGDTGLLTAVRLRRVADLTVVAPRGGMVSGQELGLRLAQPDTWLSTSLFPADRYPALAGAQVLHGRATAVDADAQTVTVRLAGGRTTVQPYDVLVIATGTTSGFWRSGRIEDLATVEARVRQHAALLQAARSVAVVGGGASGVSVAYNLKRRRPDQAVHLVHRGAALLPAYPAPTREALTQDLQAAGVQLHLGRSVRTPDRPPTGPTPGPVVFSDGDALPVDAAVWTTGAAQPNTDFLPPAWLDAEGFVRVTDTLLVEGETDVFAVGDVAATDPQRSSARNAGHAVVAANVRARLRGRAPPRRLRPPPPRRWGSVLGLQPEGMTVYLPKGQRLRFGPWLSRTFLFQLVVRRLLFRGIRSFALIPPEPGGVRRG